jgi:hypothetical protein
MPYGLQRGGGPLWISKKEPYGVESVPRNADQRYLAGREDYRSSFGVTSLCAEGLRSLGRRSPQQPWAT